MIDKKLKKNALSYCFLNREMAINNSCQVYLLFRLMRHTCTLCRNCFIFASPIQLLLTLCLFLFCLFILCTNCWCSWIASGSILRNHSLCCLWASHGILGMKLGFVYPCTLFNLMITINKLHLRALHLSDISMKFESHGTFK